MLNLKIIEGPIELDMPRQLRAWAIEFRKKHPSYGTASQGYQFLMEKAVNEDLRHSGFEAGRVR